MKTLIISANASRANLFESENLHSEHPKLKDLKSFVHTESELKNSELIADDHANQTYSANGISGAIPHKNPKDKEAGKFAKLLGDEIKKLHDLHTFDDLLLVASPEFCGLLKKQVPSNISSTETLNKDYTHCSTSELSELLAKHLFLKE